MVSENTGRTKKLIENILGASFFKGINIIFSFLLVRYSIQFMGEEKYGYWLTLLSFFTWFSALEVGISNSFRNQITNYFSDKNYGGITLIINKAYKALIITYLIVSVLLISSSFFFPFHSFFSPKEIVYTHFNITFQISTVLYMFYFVVFFLNTVLLSIHHTKATYLITAIQNGILLIGIVSFSYFNITPSFLLVCIWFTAIPLLVWTIASVFSFTSFLNTITPQITHLRKRITPFRKVKKSFIFIQFCTLIIFSTDNIIIAKVLSGPDVTKYNIAFKYFNMLTVIFNLILVPYWASFTEASHQKDKQWIIKNIKKLLLVWIGIVLLSVFMALFSNFAYQLWIGKEVVIPIILSLIMAISVLLTAWNNIFAYFLNSISEIKLQTRLLIVSAIINIPLSLIFISYFQSTGVILATCISLLPLSIALPIQYRSIIQKMN